MKAKKVISEVKKSAKIITETSLNRIYSHLLAHDCAVISAWRTFESQNCADNRPENLRRLTRKEKNRRNAELTANFWDAPAEILNQEADKKLTAVLLYSKYKYTAIHGTYVENFMTQNAVEVRENSYFVVNDKDNPEFISDIIKLGEYFCQDSVLIMRKGGENNYLFGTNLSDFPGYHKKVQLGKFKPGIEGEFMTKIGNRPFVTEAFFQDFKDMQVNTKGLIAKIARPILEEIKKTKI